MIVACIPSSWGAQSGPDAVSAAAAPQTAMSNVTVKNELLFRSRSENKRISMKSIIRTSAV
jgi:hypothetical protein